MPAAKKKAPPPATGTKTLFQLWGSTSTSTSTSPPPPNKKTKTVAAAVHVTATADEPPAVVVTPPSAATKKSKNKIERSIRYEDGESHKEGLLEPALECLAKGENKKQPSIRTSVPAALESPMTKRSSARKKRRVIVESDDDEASEAEFEIDAEEDQDEEEEEPDDDHDEEFSNTESDNDEEEEDLVMSDDACVPSTKKEKPSSNNITATAKASKNTNSVATKGAWNFLMKSPQPKVAPEKKRKSSSHATKHPASSSSSGQSKGIYTGGDDLPVISHPQDMFHDMIFHQLTKCSRHQVGQNNMHVLDPLIQTLNGRPLRIATMCSGTESPVLALDMISKSIDDFYQQQEQLQGDNNNTPENTEAGPGGGGRKLQIEHVFSCEIEPFKQAYIERNFQPPYLFRDIRELGNEKAHTAYGSQVDVPNEPGCVDLLIAGTSCVDYSNLNNEKKTIEGDGESGQTFRGMMDWIKKSQCPLVILENVVGAPWEQKCQMFRDIGYHAEFERMDTKKFYIPHTRQRGYLFAIRKNPCHGKIKIPSNVVTNWKGMVKDLERPASATLDAFMLPNDDPRVLRGRARLAQRGKDNSGNRVDWARCENRHLLARSEEELGDQRPFTGWSDAGNTALPSFAWNDWMNAQVHRIHDLTDINTLRLAKDGGIDATYKTMVWNLSQNVDRDTMGKLGLCMCLTPSGVPYVTNRGGPLVGEEVLALQGIPADDLLLPRESEENLKDLAGNAMSTTVVGACMLSALVLGHKALYESDGKKVGELVRSLVPRPLEPANTEIEVTQKLGKYRVEQLSLGQQPKAPYNSLEHVLSDALASAQKCLSEGRDKILECSELLKCSLCSQTCSVENATPARKFEEHNFEALGELEGDRIDPCIFRQKLLDQLPMQIVLDKFHPLKETNTSSIDNDIWNSWSKALETTTMLDDSKSEERELAVFSFKQIDRTHEWTVQYSSANGSKLDLRISGTRAQWFLFAVPPAKRGAIRDVLERPVARMLVENSKKTETPLSLLSGEWELCYPLDKVIDITIRGEGKKLESWASKLGLKGSFEKERRFEQLHVSIETPGHEQLKKMVNGVFEVLPKCGGACGSLHKRISDGSQEDMYFFLESGRRTMPYDDAFIFSSSKHRTRYEEYRAIALSIDPKVKYRPLAPTSDKEEFVVDKVKAIVPGSWIATPQARAMPAKESNVTFSYPTAKPTIPMTPGGWKTCPEVLRCDIPIQRESDPLYRDCVAASTIASPTDRHNWVDLNLKKAKGTLDAIAFVMPRLSVPTAISQSWVLLENCPGIVDENGEDAPCSKCAPEKPTVKWTRVTEGKKQLYLPREDVKDASTYEQAVKHRPHPFVVRLRALTNEEMNQSSGMALQMSIGCNVVSLTQRSFGLLPFDTLAREAMKQQILLSGDQAGCMFDFRVVPHIDKSSSSTGMDFKKLFLTSNKKDKPATQPPHFIKYPLRPEQLRSLHWMLSQEATQDPYLEEEVSEAILPRLDWRAEGRVRRPVLVRGGIVADEVGYGKTAITLGLIDAAPAVNGSPPTMPAAFSQSHLQTKATLVVVPAHLMGQWPKEIQKFTKSAMKVCVINTMASFNSLSMKEVASADIIVVNFTVWSSDKYLTRLARFAGVNASSMPSGKTGGRRFDAIYAECLSGLRKRVQAMKKDFSTVFDSIEDDAYSNVMEEQNASSSVRLTKKKGVYKLVSEKATKEATDASQPEAFENRTTPNGTLTGGNRKKGMLRKDGVNDKIPNADRDPWGLHSSKADIDNMKSPPLEMFFFHRIVVDEFHYLADKANRARVFTCVKGLNSSFRWFLSGTPHHASFGDVQTLSNLLGVHLGVNDAAISKNDKETTTMEKLSSLLEARSPQWHERRHGVAQSFLDRFVRQNIAEIDEIKCEEHIVKVSLPPQERGIYLEIATALQSLEMNGKRAMKSKNTTKGDRAERLAEVLEGSQSAEEALLKKTCTFDLSSESTTALKACERIIETREEQKLQCEEDLKDNCMSALRQRLRILHHHPQWKGMKQTEKGEVQDRLALFIDDVAKHQSIAGGADEEIHVAIKKILDSAQEEVRKVPEKYDSHYAEVNGDNPSDEDDESKGKKRKRSNATPKKVSEEALYAMKFALREHMHGIRTLGKELCGRTRSLRYFKSVRDFQLSHTAIKCPSCSNGKTLTREKLGVLSSCGHVGCLKCLVDQADKERCIHKTCQAPVKFTNVVKATELGADGDHDEGGKHGAKLSQVVSNIKRVVDNGDRVLVFVQFQDLKQKVADVLEENGLKTLQVKGTVLTQIKTLDVMQKEVPGPKDPRILLLTMDDESSAGVNLTTCNHAFFLHPLLANTKQQYHAYETQAIGRVRRFGQNKTVHIWRYFAVDTIDTEIFKERTGQDVN